MSDIVKKDVFAQSTGLTLNKGKPRSTSSPFQQRVNEAKASVPDAASMPNRLCLMLDRSSSMSGLADYDPKKHSKSKIELLKDAVDNFVGRCNFNDTSVAIESFPPQLQVALTNVGVMLTTSIFGMTASGNTPMKACVVRCLSSIPMTRGIIVSDGEATDWHGDFDYESLEEDRQKHEGRIESVLTHYKKAGIPIDCVHIGDSSSGEELLRRIALETGGVYLKFTDVSAFSTAFAYLTPSFRAMLMDGRVTSNEIGAKEMFK